MIWRQFPAIALLLAHAALFGQPKVSVFAGAKPPLTIGGALAVQTPLGAVSAITVDASGTVYFADATQSLLMKVTPDGRLTVVGGNGSYSTPGEPQGDGGPATKAPLDVGFPIAVDSSGNVFLVDYSSIRKITPDGILHTALIGSQQLPYGSGNNKDGAWDGFFPGLAVDTQGRIFFAELPGARVWRFDPDGTLTLIAGNGTYGQPGGDGGPATDAVLGLPQGIAVDASGNVYIADALDGLIREVNAANGTISTFAGGGSTDFRFDAPVAATSASLSVVTLASLAFNPEGDLCFFSYEPNLACISNGMISLIPIQQDGFSGDGGPASQAQFQPSDAYTSQFAIDTSGNIYIPDGGNGRVRKIDTSGPVTTIAGNGNYRFAGDGGPAAAALINAPRYVSVDPAGNIYIADTGNYRVRKVAPDGIIHTVAGNGQTYLDSAQPPTGIPALNAPLSMWIYAATGTPDGGFYFSEGFSLMHVDPTGTVTTVSGTIYPPGPLADQIPATPFSSNDVEGMAIGPDGCLYLADTGAILRFNPNGNISTVAGLFDYTGIDNGTLGAPRGFAFGAVSSQNAAPPRGNGSQSQSAPREGTLPLHNPRGPIAPIYFADDLHGYVREIDSDGRVSVIAGNGQVGYSGDGGPAIDASFFYPQAVAIDKAGFIYIADWGNGRIRRVSPNGIIDTLLSGLSYPQALAIDAQGTLYIADWGNNRVLSITNPAE